jgi:hypothetical protein
MSVIKVGQQGRQGELWLVPAPESALKNLVAYDVGNKALLGIGEGGNAHTLTVEETGTIEWLLNAIEDINEVKARGAVGSTSIPIVRITGHGVIEHSDRAEQHGEIEIQPIAYYVVPKIEQYPWEEEARRVAD